MVVFPRAATVAAVVFVLALLACSDQVISPSDLPSTYAGVPARQAPVDSLAHGLALALSSPALRQQVLDDLRDSPFRQHGIHLQSYLRGARGRSIAEAAARGLGITGDQFLQLLDVVPQSQLSMPRSLDRVKWSGTDDIVVFGTTATLAERAAALLPEHGYTVGGEPVVVSVWRYPPFPFLAIAPAEQSFGLAPETRRAAAPKHHRSTISTRSEEIEAITVGAGSVGESGTLTIPLDPCVIDDTCPPPPPVPRGEFIPYTSPQCFTSYPAGEDQDNDQIWDQCEYHLALALRPYMQFMSDDDNLDRETYWAVTRHRTQPGWVQIFYAIGYREDGGTPSGGFTAHQGDSEFVIIEAKPGQIEPYYSTIPGQYWELAYITLSAHWQAPTDGTARYSYDRLYFPRGNRGRPEVWVAEDKHANYRSQSVCDAGAFYTDNCDNPLNHHLTLEVLANANVGSSHLNGGNHLVDCVNSRKGFLGRECFWEAVNFHGWLNPRQGGGAGPYGESLTHFGF